ncbi:MAG: GGDEF domain-containing protein [Nocardioidaceae bacterium]
MMLSVPMLSPAMSFDDAALAVLRYLREALPLAFWSVTRVENDRQTYLYLDSDNGYGLVQGQSHPWDESFCIHMAVGTGPCVAPDAQAVPVYAAAGVNAAATIGSYAGAVVREPDGTLFGAICGIDPDVRTDDAAFAAAGPVLQLLGQLLTMVLAANRERDVTAGEVAAARRDAETDVLTGLANRRAWERLVAYHGERFARLGDPTVVAMIDLDMLKVINDEQGHEAGDDYIRRAGNVLRATARGVDVIARLGGDEFGLVLTDCTESMAESFVRRLYVELDLAGVAGSVGWAPITVLRGLPAALVEADAAMYVAKTQRRAARRHGLKAAGR